MSYVWDVILLSWSSVILSVNIFKMRNMSLHDVEKVHVSLILCKIQFNALKTLAPTYLSHLQTFYNPPVLSINYGLLSIPRTAKMTTGGRSISSIRCWSSITETWDLSKVPKHFYKFQWLKIGLKLIQHKMY